VQRIGNGQAKVGCSVTGRSGDTVCGLYRTHENEEREFLGCASKPRSGFPVWALKPVVSVW
jgi:hypothetical protein